MRSYKEAIKVPERGWKYADDEQMVAAAAQGFAAKLCMNPEVIYKWINDVYAGNWELAGREIHKHSPLICAGAIMDGYKVSEY